MKETEVQEASVCFRWNEYQHRATPTDGDDERERHKQGQREKSTMTNQTSRRRPDDRNDDLDYAVTMFDSSSLEQSRISFVY
jgi:hypothetical protein